MFTSEDWDLGHQTLLANRSGTMFRVCVDDLTRETAPYPSLKPTSTLTSHLGRFPFVRTDQPDPSLRNENFTINQNYPARSVKS